MHKVVVIGAAIVDVLLKSKSLRVMKSHQIEGGVAMCEVLGGKTEAEDGVLVSGGGGTNVAVGLHRLGEAVKMIARVGDDDLSEVLIKQLEKESVDLSFLQRAKGKTGLSAVLVSMDGGRSIVTYRGESGELKENYEVVVWQEKDISREDLLREVKGVTGIISLLTEKIDGVVMDAAGPTLKVISNYAVGFDNIDIAEATKRGICVTNTPGVLTEAVAEEVIALTLALFRRIAEGDRFIRSGKYKGWEPDLLLGTGLKDKVMGIVGLGRIGRWTARMASALGMKVIYFNRHRDEEFEEEYEVAYHSLDQLLEMADVVSMSVPLTEETRHMIGEAELKLMKPTALLINTARGGGS